MVAACSLPLDLLMIECDVKAAGGRGLVGWKSLIGVL